MLNAHPSLKSWWNYLFGWWLWLLWLWLLCTAPDGDPLPDRLYVFRRFWEGLPLLLFTSGEVSEGSSAVSSSNSSKTVAVPGPLEVDLLARIIPSLKLAGYMLPSTMPPSLLLRRLCIFEFAPVLLEETTRICDGVTVCIPR